jgi:hypothetical protein
MRPGTTHLLIQAHLAVTCSTGACAWQPVDKAVATGSLECHLCFVASSCGNMGCHDLRLQCLVELRDVLLRLALLSETAYKLVVLCFE